MSTMHFYTFLAGRSTESSLTNTDAFASILGEEIVSRYHRQNSDIISKGSPAVAVGVAAGGGRGGGAAAPTTPRSTGPLTNGLLGGMTLEQGSSPPPHLLTPPAAHSHSYRAAVLSTGSPVALTTTTPRSDTAGSSSTSSSGCGGPSSTASSSPAAMSLSQVLDTADVSQKIREILSSHNIGQRLFAKHVLGLSQGTVSELLSKPKHWDKLTEKGRESYRKMHAWATDEANVIALKAISPKKGKPQRKTRQKVHLKLVH